MKRIRLALGLVLMLALLLACASAETMTITDMAGRTADFDKDITRIIALNPADCEIVYALGCEDILVGRGEYCDYPEAVQALPSVNSGEGLNIEQVLALQPEAIIMSKMAQTTEQVAALEAAGIKVIISDAQTIEQVYEAIEMIGMLLNEEAGAETLVNTMRTGFEAVAAQAATTGKTIYFEISPLEWGLWTAGKNTFMDELAALCGLTNAFADVNGWAEVSQEQVLERNPDYIVTTTDPSMAPAEEIMGRTGWETLNAVKQGGVFVINSNAVTRPGPRLLEAAQELVDYIAAAEGEEGAA